VPADSESRLRTLSPNVPSMPGNSEMTRNFKASSPAALSGKTTLALLWAITFPSDVEM
jgi:hypothetical protein